MTTFWTVYDIFLVFASQGGNCGFAS